MFQIAKKVTKLHKKMIRSIVFLLSMMTISIFANPGDILYQRCQTITIAGQSLQNVCIVLKQAQECAVVSWILIFGFNLLFTFRQKIIICSLNVFSNFSKPKKKKKILN